MKIDVAQWQQLSELLDTALELAADERLQWVDALSEELAELKPTLRELLLQTTGVETKDFLDRPPDFAAALMADSTHTDWAEEFQVDKVMGAYRLIRELGRGGMGTVWLAERIDGKLKRQVALKFPYAGPNQRQLAERLAREREILASLEHPNIARLYDADVTASGQPFLVLEYINGMPISEYCDHHQLSIDERLKLFQQVLDAVRYAHSHLVIHRDLKPSNILITSDGIAHLLDFGIAKLTKDGELKETVLTQINGRALTPDYASPEQIMGGTITTVSDVYSLGVLLYELLTGTRPYRLCRDTRNALEEAIVTADVVLPSRAEINEQCAECRNISLRQLQKALAGDLDTLILKALKRSPAERYASTDAFFDDVNRYIHQQPILAQPDSQWYRAKKFITRNQLVVASAVTIALALIIGIGAALWQAHRAELQRDRAVASAARSEAVTDFLQLMVTEVADADEPITMQQLIARSENIANRTYVGNAGQQAAILEVLGNYYMSFGRVSDAERAFNKAIVIGNLVTDSGTKAMLLCSSAYAEFELGNTQLAKQRMRSGFALAYAGLDVQRTCLRVRANLKYQEADLSGALQDIQQAKQQMQRSGINNPVSVAELMSDAAQVFADLGRTVDAEREYKNAVELLNRIGRGETKAAMEIQNNWAVALDTSGNPSGALLHYDKVIEIARKRGMGSSQGEMYAANRAYALHQLGRDDEALIEYQKAIDTARKNDNMYELISAQQRMAGALIALGRLEDSKMLMSEMNVLVSRMPASDPMTLQGIHTLNGLLAMKESSYEKAVINFTANIDYLVTHNMQGGYLAYRYAWRGEAFLKMGKIDEAISDATKSYQIATKIQAESTYSSITGVVALLLAKISHAQNKNDDAHKWANIAFEQLQGSVGAQHPNTLEAKQLLASVSAISK